jgi:hypothetical protein
MRLYGPWRCLGFLGLLGSLLSRLLSRKVENVRRRVVVVLANDDLDPAESARIEPVERDDLVVEQGDLDASGIERGDRSLRLTDAGESLDDL